MEQIKSQGCQFLVAGRLLEDTKFTTLKDLDIPDGFRSIFHEIPESEFRNDVSSSFLRNQESD